MVLLALADKGWHPPSVERDKRARDNINLQPGNNIDLASMMYILLVSLVSHLDEMNLSIEPQAVPSRRKFQPLMSPAVLDAIDK